MEYPDDPLHGYILELSAKPKPAVLFLPTASGDDQAYIKSFYRAYNEEVCTPSHLALFYRKELDLRSYILKHDIIHVGGGNTANMIAVWKLHGVDKILREAYDMGKVMCGGSAGAICWFEGGVTDSFGDSELHPLMGCLSFLEGSICPHYDGDALRRPAYHDFLLKNQLPAGYAADDQVALHFQDDSLKAAVTSRADGKAYRVHAEDGHIIEQEIPTELLS